MALAPPHVVEETAGRLDIASGRRDLTTTGESAASATSLRSALILLAAGVGTLAVVVCVALVALTTVLRNRGHDVAVSAASVQTADQIEIALLMRHGARDAIGRSAEKATLLASLDVLERYIQAPAEARLVEELRAAVEQYLAAAPGEPAAEVAFEEALTAARRVVAFNVGHVLDAIRRARRADQLANILGVSAATALILGMAGALLWLRRYAFRPMVHLNDAMHRFAQGDLSARAPEEGVVELRAMAGTFNELALALGQTRQNQLRYLTSVIHDFRNPLAAVQLAAGYVDPERPLPPEPRIRQLFAMIRRQLDWLNTLVGDVLNTAMIEAGQLVLRKEECDARLLVQESAGVFEAMSPAHVIEVAVPPGPVRLRCDHFRIVQVLNNLLSNALKFSPLGSTIQIILVADAARVVFSVSDRGEGIAPEDQTRIFEAFKRSGGARDRVSGAGLGLYISRRIVEAHDGRLDVVSELGVGSTFTVTLPRG